MIQWGTKYKNIPETYKSRSMPIVCVLPSFTDRRMRLRERMPKIRYDCIWRDVARGLPLEHSGGGKRMLEKEGEQ